jgi:GNAT superfamily N-acetyltransferase/DNA-binding Lrp family transcriptional regulator
MTYYNSRHFSFDGYTEAMAEWTFLTNHAHVLICVADSPHARVREIADLVGITERAAHRILAELEEDGYLTRTRDGRRNLYALNTGMPLRHPMDRAHRVAELLSVFSPTSHPEGVEALMSTTGSSYGTESAADQEALAKITKIVQLAFMSDPTWAPLVTPTGEVTPESYEYWELFTRSAQRYPWTFLNAEGSATSIWYPPNALELTAEEEDALPAFARRVLGEERTQKLIETVEKFDAASPDGEYFYLSLLAVDPAHSKKGLGMKLLAENLALIDQTGMPSYLESSNPINDVKYQRLGYKPHGRIDLPSGLSLTTMWRDPR